MIFNHFSSRQMQRQQKTEKTDKFSSLDSLGEVFEDQIEEWNNFKLQFLTLLSYNLINTTHTLNGLLV